MRVLHVSPSFYPALMYGGPVMALYQLCLSQLAAGHLVTVLTSDAAGAQRIYQLPTEQLPAQQLPTQQRPTQQLPIDARQHLPLSQLTDVYGVPTYYAPVWLRPDVAPGLVLPLARLIRKVEVVHVTGVFSVTSLLGLLAAAVTRKPCVWSPHGALLPKALQQGSAHKRRLLQLWAPVLRQVRGLHVNSQEEAAGLALLRDQGLLHPKAVIRVLANGVSLAPPSPPLPAPEPSASQPPHLRPPRLLCLGRMHPVKRLELAIDTLHALKAHHPSAELLLAAPEPDPAYQALLQQQAARLGIADSVHFLGPVSGSAKTDLLASADVLLLTSHTESFGIVVAEALLAGTPAVAVHDTPWQLLPRAQVGDWVAATPQALCTALLPLLQTLRDPPQAQALRTRCQQLAQTQFAWPAIELELRQLYMEAMGAR